MIYKLVINAAFLAIGYYIGKEVGRTEQIRKEITQPRRSTTETADKPQAQDSANESSS